MILFFKNVYLSLRNRFFNDDRNRSYGFEEDPEDSIKLTTESPKFKSEFKNSSAIKLLKLGSSKITFPSSKKLKESYFPSIYDQGSLSSCVAQSFATVLTYIFRRAYYENNFTEISKKIGLVFNKGPKFSRMFLWYGMRKKQDKFPENCGGSLLKMHEFAAEHGVCEESSFKYSSKYTETVPPKSAFEKAKKISEISCVALSENSGEKGIELIKLCLNANIPVPIGAKIYGDFSKLCVTYSSDGPFPKATKCVVPPKTGKEKTGGHCVVITGYDDSIIITGVDTKGAFIFRNSWGNDWGSDGCGYISYEYVQGGHITNPKILLHAKYDNSATTHPTEIFEKLASHEHYDEIINSIKF